MKNDFKVLYDFIDSAVKSRKYPESSAKTYRAALKIYESELNPEEQASIELFNKNIDQIAQSVFSKHKLGFSASSLSTYKYRVQKVLSDYENYGTNPAKMAGWNPVVRKQKQSKKAKDQGISTETQNPSPNSQTPAPLPDGMHRIELSLRPEAPVVLIIPRDIKQHEVDTINSILDSLVKHGEENDQA